MPTSRWETKRMPSRFGSEAGIIGSSGSSLHPTETRKVKEKRLPLCNRRGQKENAWFWLRYSTAVASRRRRGKSKRSKKDKRKEKGSGGKKKCSSEAAASRRSQYSCPSQLEKGEEEAEAAMRCACAPIFLNSPVERHVMFEGGETEREREREGRRERAERKRRSGWNYWLKEK